MYDFMGYAYLRANQDLQKQGPSFSLVLFDLGGNVLYHKPSVVRIQGQSVK